MAVELRLGSTGRDFVGPLDMGHFMDTDGHDFSVTLKTGELVMVAAQVEGVDLSVDDEFKGDSLLSLVPGRIVNVLRRKHGDIVARKVLKEARSIANRSQFNGDKDDILSHLRGLIGSLGRTSV